MPEPRIPDFIESLETMREVHLKKNRDYATADSPFSNFDFAEFIIKHFSNERDKVFVTFIATKLARLATLLSSDRVPDNEPVNDSFIDIANYVLLWKAKVKEEQERTKIDLVRELIEAHLPPFVMNEVTQFKCQIHDITNCATCVSENKEFYAIQGMTPRNPSP